MAAPGPSTSAHVAHARIPTSKSSVQTSFSRCTQCSPPQKENGKEPRNLIVCIDGTSNQFGQNNTNVVKLFAKIDLETTHPQPQQFAYYSSGIGTRPKTLHVFQRMERAVTDKFDMAIAWNMEEIVKDAYGWLARMYQEGDQIYLFGFSRGAYQVRVLAGMIHEVGLIRTPTDKQIGTAYDHYEDIRSGKPKTREIAREFKNTFSWKDLRVHFVGVWDTVSSVGLIRGDVFLSTSSSAAHACHFRHALALDELRVKFMPEYFHEMNSETDDVKVKYVDTPLDPRHQTTSRNEQRESTGSERANSSSGEGKNLNELSMKGSTSRDFSHSATSQSDRHKPKNSDTVSTAARKPDIKEVWFAGSHSDVGGKNRPGKSPQAGNVSLLWMRREAVENGLVLLPTDVVWVPDDLDLGISNSMSSVWRLIEYLPIKHQVSFSGPGEDKRRVHQLHPRRIIPGQKVHASILYVNAYKPQATLGEGFDIPITHAEHDDTILDDRIWETGLFDDTAAQELVNSLSGQQGVAPIYLDRLLFLLRFKEGKQCVRNVFNWEKNFEEVIQSKNCAPLVRLVTIVAYYEASCKDPESPAQPRMLPSLFAFNDAKRCLFNILDKHKHRDGPRVVALLRPLTKHKDLRDRILTKDILEKLVKLLDKIVGRKETNFGQGMDGLESLLRCDDTRPFIVGKLAANPSGSTLPRLLRILKVKDPLHLVAALRMVLTLACIPDQSARALFSETVKIRLIELASKNEGLVGLLAVEISLTLYNPNAERRLQLNLRNLNVRANIATALVRMNFDAHEVTEHRGHNSRVDPSQQILGRIFGLDAEILGDRPKGLIKELKDAVQSGKARERTAATMTLLKLCEAPVIRNYLCEIKLLDVLVYQLQRKDTALLAAYALATSLEYNDMKESIQDNELLPKYIVGMLRLDFFDDAVGQVEGFHVFGNIMRHDDLREKIKKYNIAEVLERKLGKGKPNEIRTSLICLDIYRSFDQDGSGAHDLVDMSLKRLKDPLWKVQRAGVAILSALSQTEYGVAAIKPRVHEVIEMLLPEGYLPILPNEQPEGAITSTEGEGQVEQVVTVPEPTDNHSVVSEDAPTKPPSWMMGPSCALRILAQNEELREIVKNTMQYGSLKHLYLSGTLVGREDTSPWRIDTPNRTDVTKMLDKLIKVVDGELSEEGLMSIGDTTLPHIRHWDRLMALVRNWTLGGVTILPGFLGVSALAILGVVTVVPIYFSVKAYEVFQKVWSRYRNGRFLDHMQSAITALAGHTGQTDEGHEVESGSSGDNAEDPSGRHGHGDRNHQGVETVPIQGVWERERTA